MAHKMVKTKIYPRPHNWVQQLSPNISVTAQTAFYIPLLGYDEVLANPEAYYSHPEHPSFAEADGYQCYPDSVVENGFASVEFAMSKTGRETDKIKNLKVYVTPVYVSFLENLTAIDEKTSGTCFLICC